MGEVGDNRKVGDVGENGSEVAVSSSESGERGFEAGNTVPATISASSSFERLILLVPLSIESVCACCALPRPQRRAFGGRGFWPR